MARLQDFQTVTPTSNDKFLIIQSQGQGLSTIGTVETKISNAVKSDVINTLADCIILEKKNGSIVSFNTDIAAKLLDCNTEITATQAGTGTPSPDNERAITGVDTVDVIACGKNFTQITETTDSHNGITYTFNNDGTISASGSVPSGNSYKNVGHFILQAGTYTISGLPSSLVADARKCAMVLCKDAYSGSVNIIKTIYSNIALSDQFTLTEATDCYLRIYVYAAAGAISDVNFAPQIELGTSATSFEKFKGTTHTTTLPETIYGGNASLTEGTGIKTWGYVEFDGSADENWTMYSVAEGTLFRIQNNGNKIITPTNTKCDQYQVVDSANRTNLTLSCASAINMDFINNSYSTVEQWKTALSNAPVHVAFEMQTPTTFNTTPEQIPTLSGENNIYSNAGNVDITYQETIGHKFGV